MNACAAPDGGSETLCMPDGGAPYCANTASDNQNCGGCGITCVGATSCVSGACVSVGCPVYDGLKSQAGPHVEYGYCWYLTKDGETCDHACGALGGSNLATSAENAWADSCTNGATSADVSTWFLDNGNAGGWTTSTGFTTFHTLGYGYRNSDYYPKCASGTTTGCGTFPGDPNQDPTRSVVCPCFATP